MAEVYLGLREAIGGFQKLVVMKRLLGWQSSDKEAIDRLLAEARIAATINHPNVVSTLDIGLDGGAPYIVLEYLSGEDLRFILRDLRERNASVPLAIACRIGASIAAALHEAHQLTLPDGTSQSIVHRDVTPSNIIVCYGGVSKLVDFGVARVQNDIPKTKAGTVKGKFSYLAPEQLSNKPLDGRTDIFQLGIVLWEMLTMERLFDGGSDHERVNAVLHRPIRPPSELNPALPPCLDRTAMRALSRDPEGRHRDAHELEVELLEALGALGASGGDHSVGEWMQVAFGERRKWRQDLERRTLAELQYEVSIEVQLGTASTEIARPAAMPAPAGSVSAPAWSATGSSIAGMAIEGSVAAPPAGRGIGRFLLGAGSVVALLAAVMWWRGGVVDLGGERDGMAAPAAAPEAPADYEVDIRAVPAHASIAVDGRVLARGRYRASFADDGTVHTVTITAPEHATVQRRFRGPAAIEIHLEELALATAAPDVEPAIEPPPEESISASAPARRRRRGVRDGGAARPRLSPDPAPDAAPRVAEPKEVKPAPRKRPKPKDVFVPATDNIDPFKDS